MAELKSLTQETRDALIRNIKYKASVLASVDPAAFSTHTDRALIELDYTAETSWDAVERYYGRVE